MKCNCHVCGKSFVSYNPNPKFCSLACKAKSEHSQLDAERVILEYQSGGTQKEIGFRMGVSQKAIRNLLIRNGIQSRPAIARNQTGANNGNWKGDQAGYAAFHKRLTALHGNLRECQVCGTDDPSKIYDWANLTGRYEDPSDFKRMCRSCHRLYDKAGRNFKGAVGGRPSPSREVMPNA